MEWPPGQVLPQVRALGLLPVASLQLCPSNGLLPLPRRDHQVTSPPHSSPSESVRGPAPLPRPQLLQIRAAFTSADLQGRAMLSPPALHTALAQLQPDRFGG